MIRKPEFVTPEFAAEVIKCVRKRKPLPLPAEVRYETITEDDCVQIMHIGFYDYQSSGFTRMEAFAEANDWKQVSKIHRKIYLCDALKKLRLKNCERF